MSYLFKRFIQAWKGGTAWSSDTRGGKETLWERRLELRSRGGPPLITLNRFGFHKHAGGAYCCWRSCHRAPTTNRVGARRTLVYIINCDIGFGYDPLGRLSLWSYLHVDERQQARKIIDSIHRYSGPRGWNGGKSLFYTVEHSKSVDQMLVFGGGYVTRKKVLLHTEHSLIWQKSEWTR